MRAPGALVGAAFATLLVLQPQSASASWATTGSGSAPAGAASVERATAPTATQVGSTVRLDWAAAALNEGTPATGYTVLRHVGATVTQICTTPAPTRTCVDSAPVQGSQYGVVARYRSWAGPESPTTVLTLDQVPPATTLSSNPAPNAAGWTRSAVTITLTATDAASSVASITYRVGAGSPVTVTGSSTSFGVSAQGSTAISYYATDTFGNVETTRSYTVRIDTAAPATPVITNSISTDSGASGSDRVTNVAAQTLSGTAEAGSTVTISRGATTYPSVVAAANGTWTVPVTLAEGANSFTAVATDPAGNSSTASAGVSATLDTGLPTVTITDPRNGVAYKNNSGASGWGSTCSGTPGACGTSSDSGSGVTSVTLVLRDSSAGTCWNGATFATCGTPLALPGTTTWSRAIAYSVVTNRSLQLTVTATDLAGNTGTASVGFSAQ